MNLLKDHANLFVKKFKVKHDDRIWQIEKYDSTVNGFKLVRDHPTYNERYCLASQCTLIARPTEDMTEKEWEGMSYGKSATDYFLHHFYLNMNDCLHLLSLRVYPGPQSHFKDGTVIDSRTI